MSDFILSELSPPRRILMGPGPSNVNEKVYKALSTQIIGHLDPEFIKLMDEISEMLRQVFKTKNRLTIPISGTGSSGMETCFVNVIEPGDKAVVGVNGLFGERMCDVATRCGAEVIRIEEDWGNIVKPEIAIDTLKKHPDAKVFAIVHAETSTGVNQPLTKIGDYLKDRETLYLVDAVTSLAGCELKVDEWNIDLCYSGTQKCISVPPGLAPITISDKASYVISSRKSKVLSWYFDLSMIERYWGTERIYHHTAPISMLYGLREGLKLVLEEGLENRFERHIETGDYLKEKMVELGFGLFAQEGYRLSMLSSVVLPKTVDDDFTRQKLLFDYGIEVGVGLGETKGKIWRIGSMGETCKKEYVDILISSLRKVFQ